MKLFVNCKKCGFKIYINHPAKIRSDLPFSFQLICQNCSTKNNCNPYDVVAESGLTTAGGALLGGLLGLPLGGVGALVGAILGGIIGKNSQDQDEINVTGFNNS